MRINLKSKSSDKLWSRFKKKIRVRKKINGSEERPRLSIFRSARHIYAQIIDDSQGRTLVSASTVELEIAKAGNKDAAKAVGEAIAKKALAKNIENVVFDRSGLLYHGRVKSLADGAREAGLKF